MKYVFFKMHTNLCPEVFLAEEGTPIGPIFEITGHEIGDNPEDAVRKRMKKIRPDEEPQITIEQIQEKAWKATITW